MKVSSSWIKERLRRTMLDDQKVVEALERAGIEIEQITSSKKIDKRVVVALVKKVVQHPGADRLHLVDVTTGEGEYRVVCGAPNVREGIKVALAQIGTILPGGDRIEKAKLRGEVSEGMLCSERELGLGQDHNGIMELSNDVVLGTALCDIHPADTVIDIKTPANRFDVLSVIGLAREVAAMTDAELEPLSPLVVETSAKGPAIEAGAEAGRYMLAKLRIDQSTPSPRQVVARLQAAGVRSLGPVVDVTNYVMLEMGQPLHAFDAVKVKLPVSVRYARAGEKLVTLDGVERMLTADDLVIADQSGPIALAGVMGGASTEVSPETTDILLEAAVFDGAVVRKTAKRHGLRTEASARFERNLPVALTPLALSRAVELLGQWAGGKLEAASDQLNVKPETYSITLPLALLSKLMGFEVLHKDAKVALEKLQIGVGESSNDQIVIPEVPWWRPDLRLPEDLVEEIVRVMGYDNVPSTIPQWRPTRLQFDRVRAKQRQVREVLYGAGLFEVMTYSFVSLEQLEQLGLDASQHLKLKNPLSSEQAYLRSSLLPSHLSVLERNRTYAKSVGFYEISNVFVKRGVGEQPDEPQRLAVTVRRDQAAYAVVKGVADALARVLNVDVEVRPKEDSRFAPGRTGELLVAGRPAGVVGQLHPQKLQAMKIGGEAAYMEVDLAPLAEAAAPRQFAGTRRFPTISRDLAILVPQAVTWAELRAAAGLEALEYVGDYYGAELPAGFKSVTLRLTLSNPDRTPTEAEAAEMESATMARLERKVGARRRD